MQFIVLFLMFSNLLKNTVLPKHDPLEYITTSKKKPWQKI